ncbi:hypothetical protein [Vibrio sp. 99-70-13A1]|uniref:hypothetical protein n=1 Tax=Vibrio sp. 99-70-13A1 TaxID=2607601 RepID=UPI00149361FD|nr:hypothetical protein [Vibrio sp. 99-70-13A1]NOH97258.1 hypothetical protein [Vibrio sp. 99-70-13A1]
MKFKTATKLVLPFTEVILSGRIRARKFQDKNELFQIDLPDPFKNQTNRTLKEEILFITFNILVFDSPITLSTIHRFQPTNLITN